MKRQKAFFAGGCFWGIQALFDFVPGVLATRAGYMGGQTENPDYRSVCSGQTGHAETVEIEYDAEKARYDSLLDLFFAAHDPTSLNKQGPDVGTQYRSAVFFTDEGQKRAALKKADELTKACVYQKPIVTQILPAGTFYPAEEYHQKYFEKNHQTPACHVSFVPRRSVDEQDLCRRLTADQYAVLRRGQTEAPFSGQYFRKTADGTYCCAACGNPVFSSESQFDSACGWPSFDKAIGGSTRLRPDLSYNMIRSEVVCAQCGSHLGHLFNDGPTRTRQRFCINSAAMDLKKS